MNLHAGALHHAADGRSDAAVLHLRVICQLCGFVLELCQLGRIDRLLIRLLGNVPGLVENLHPGQVRLGVRHVHRRGLHGDSGRIHLLGIDLAYNLAF